MIGLLIIMGNVVNSANLGRGMAISVGAVVTAALLLTAIGNVNS